METLKKEGAQFIPKKVDIWMDYGKKDPTVDTNKQILKIEHEKGIHLTSSSLVLENSEIIQPCFIGENVIIKNSKIGPYVSIGAHSTVENSSITNSLIQTNTQISNAQLHLAMIGDYAKYNGDFTSVSIGAYTELI